MRKMLKPTRMSRSATPGILVALFLLPAGCSVTVVVTAATGASGSTGSSRSTRVTSSREGSSLRSSAAASTERSSRLSTPDA